MLTVPLVALVAFGLVAGYGWLSRSIYSGWMRPVEIKDWEMRATHASCVFAARRVWTLKLPGSRLLVFRSIVGGADYRYGTHSTDTLELKGRAWAVLMDEFDPA
ncbi:hypothetical protein [Rhodococcus sp. 27YEA15]|uniref:hypothetical protein n=1 Tax=Rhodococcus sp. 27YEA15 TaxID=3156259 RepID=UPI003C7ABC3E